MWIAVLLSLAATACAPADQARLDSLEARLGEMEETALQAMAASSVIMISHHEHEIEEALLKEPVDWGEAKEEAEEIKAWIEGAHWPPEVASATQAATQTLGDLLAQVEAENSAGAKAAFEAVKEKFRDLHHQVMELVSGHEH